MTGKVDAEDLSRVAGLPQIGWLGVFALMFVVNGLGEETGWRGFMWPRLNAFYSLPKAAAIVALPWSLWHLPLFWTSTGMHDMELAMFPFFYLSLWAGSIVLGWMYDKSGSSVIVVALFHTSLNMATASEAAQGTVGLIVSAVVIAWALILIRRSGGRTKHSMG